MRVQTLFSQIPKSFGHIVLTWHDQGLCAEQNTFKRDFIRTSLLSVILYETIWEVPRLKSRNDEDHYWWKWSKVVPCQGTSKWSMHFKNVIILTVIFAWNTVVYLFKDKATISWYKSNLFCKLLHQWLVGLRFLFTRETKYCVIDFLR